MNNKWVKTSRRSTLVGKVGSQEGERREGG